MTRAPVPTVRSTQSRTPLSRPGQRPARVARPREQLVERVGRVDREGDEQQQREDQREQVVPDEPGEQHEEPRRARASRRPGSRAAPDLPAAEVGDRLVQRRDRAVGAQRELPRPEEVGLQVGGKADRDERSRNDERPPRPARVEERAHEPEHDHRHEVEEVAVDHERADRQVPGRDDRPASPPESPTRRTRTRAVRVSRGGPHDTGQQPGARRRRTAGSPSRRRGRRRGRSQIRRSPSRRSTARTRLL